MSGDARDDLYQVAALLDELERALNPLAIDERGELVSTPSVPPSLPQAPRGGGNASRGPSSPGPGQSRRSFDAERGIERLRAQPARAMEDQIAIAPAPRRAPPRPPGAQRATTTASSLVEITQRSVAPEPATSSPGPRAAEVVRPSLPAEREAPRAPVARDEAVVEVSATPRAVPAERAREVTTTMADDIAPAIPRARLEAPEQPPPVPVTPIRTPEPTLGRRREAPAAPSRRAHVRAKSPRVADPSTPVDRADAPVLPVERAAIHRSPAAPHRRARASLRVAETRATVRARRAPAMGTLVFERAYEVGDPHHAAPPLPRRAREQNSEPPRVPTPPPEVIDPFARETVFDDDIEPELDDDLVPAAPPSTIWLRGGRLRWSAGPAQLARADRSLSRLVRKRGRRL